MCVVLHSPEGNWGIASPWRHTFGLGSFTEQWVNKQIQSEWLMFPEEQSPFRQGPIATWQCFISRFTRLGRFLFAFALNYDTQYVCWQEQIRFGLISFDPCATFSGVLGKISFPSNPLLSRGVSKKFYSWPHLASRKIDHISMGIGT